MHLFRALLALFASLIVAQAKPIVVTTHTVLADFARQVGGDAVDVRCLLPVDVDPHTYEPKPADVRLLSNSQLVIENGLGLEPWTQKLIATSGYKGRLVRAADGLPFPIHAAETGAGSHGEHDAAEIDPHAWHDVRNALHYVRSIQAALSAAFPESSAEFEKNAAAYARTLEALHADALQQIGTVAPERRKLVTSHDSLGYLAHAYGLTIVPIAGTRPDQEPSAKELAKIVTTSRKERVKAVFFEQTSNPKLVQLVAREAGVAVVDKLYTDSLGAAGSGADTYASMFRANLATLVRSLK
jgi:zinc/manganese transport system substrate-binding protein